MDEGVAGNVISEIRLLIEDSCKFDKVPAEAFKLFHRTFLKFSFGALDVEMNYENKVISIWNSKPLSDTSMALGDFGNALMEKVSYTNLEETLLGCVEEGVFNERFYTHLLFDFGRFPNENGIKTA